MIPQESRMIVKMCANFPEAGSYSMNHDIARCQIKKDLWPLKSHIKEECDYLMKMKNVSKYKKQSTKQFLNMHINMYAYKQRVSIKVKS
jgi:hypothetical protein